MLCRVSAAPVSVMTRVPPGRLQARFAADVAAIDDTLPFFANLFLTKSVGFAAAAALMLFSQPLLLLLVAPMAYMFTQLQHKYQCGPPARVGFVATAVMRPL